MNISNIAQISVVDLYYKMQKIPNHMMMATAEVASAEQYGAPKTYIAKVSGEQVNEVTGKGIFIDTYF